MPTTVSNLADVHPRAILGENVSIGPFCQVGPDVVLGADCRLDSHVVITGNTVVGTGNRFWPNAVIGADPQDKSYIDGRTGVVIGDHNQFREGVTVNRGAEKEDGVTRIGDRNLIMSNAHVAHNCRIFSDTIIVNGVLLGGHVHVQDRAIISGNTAATHFCTVGQLAFVGGCSKVVRDVPPFMLCDGSDQFRIATINTVGLQRAGVPAATIAVLKQAYRRLYRECKPQAAVREMFLEELGGELPHELTVLFSSLEYSSCGKQGRGREVVRGDKFVPAPTLARAA